MKTLSEQITVNACGGMVKVPAREGNAFFEVLEKPIWTREDRYKSSPVSHIFKATNNDANLMWANANYARFVNVSPLDIFHFLYAEERYDEKNHAVLYPGNTAFYTKFDVWDEIYYPFVLPTIEWRKWKRKYGICYEISTPADWRGSLTNFIRDDLNTWLRCRYGIQGRCEVIRANCFYLENLHDDLLYAGYPTNQPYHGSKGFNAEYHTMDELIARLNYKFYRQAMPIINNTGYHGQIVFDYSNCKCLDDYARLMLPYGLSLDYRNEWLKMIIIEDAPRATTGIVRQTISRWAEQLQDHYSFFIDLL